MLRLKKKSIFASKKMKVSIITINYNNKGGLRRTIESVVCQTNNEYEFIIVDGGSNDGSVEIIKEYNRHISYWVSEKDNGIYHAMNKGVTQAHGDYCIFMNSGDIFYDNNVLNHVATIKTEEDIIVGKVAIDNNNKILTQPPLGELTMYHLYSGAIPHQGAFIHTSLLRKNPYDEKLKIISDWKFFVQSLVFDNCTILYINDYVAKYDVHGISSTEVQLMQEEKNKVLKDLFPPRILADYKNMKNSECKTYILTPLLRKNYYIDKFLYTLGRFLLKLKKKNRTLWNTKYQL